MENIDSIFKDYCNISKELQAFKIQLNNSKISDEARKKYHSELEEIQAQSGAVLQTAQAAGSAVAGQLAQMNQEIISTYREIDDCFENTQVSLIAQDALNLGSLLEKGQMAQVAKIVDRLKGRIQFLSANRRPSLQNNKIIQLAVKLTEQAIVPASGRAKLYSLQLIALLKAMIQETMQRAEQLLFPEEAELVMELYAIADLYSHHYVGQGNKRLKAILAFLPKQAEKCFSLEPAKSAELILDIAQELTRGEALVPAGVESRV